MSEVREVRGRGGGGVRHVQDLDRTASRCARGTVVAALTFIVAPVAPAIKPYNLFCISLFDLEACSMADSAAVGGRKNKCNELACGEMLIADPDLRQLLSPDAQQYIQVSLRERGRRGNEDSTEEMIAGGSRGITVAQDAHLCLLSNNQGRNAADA
eukprot:765878-Hanusia_phi.AAC.2